jgi:hypothetical protein
MASNIHAEYYVELAAQTGERVDSCVVMTMTMFRSEERDLPAAFFESFNMFAQIGGFIRSALRKRSTYFFLLLLVFLVVMIPVVRIPVDSPANKVSELHALVYALQRASTAGKQQVTLPDAFTEQAWASAAGETDVAAWRTRAGRIFKSNPVVVSLFGLSLLPLTPDC